MTKIISTNNMNENSLKKLSKSQLIKLLLQRNEELQSRKPIPAPRKSVKQMVQDYEDNIIPPPPEFSDDYKPIPKPRTQKPTPLPRTKIEQVDKALKGYTKSFEIGIKNDKDPLAQLQNTIKAIEYHIIKILTSMKGLKFVETLRVTFKKLANDEIVYKTAYFEFTNEIQNMEIANGDILVSYDVSSLFTNVPLDETIEILANRAFTNNWFNVTYDLNLTKMDFVDLLRVATKEQLFQFNGALYEQTDGVAMGSPLGPLLANVFMTSIEENLERQGKVPSFYRRYVDDALTIMPNMAAASSFLDTLNLAHSSVKFTMETENNGMLPFLGTQLLNRSPRIETKVYVKPTNSGLLLHFQSNVDNRYKNGLLRTMLDRAHRLSSSWSHFSDECDRLKSVFSRLKYPKQLVNSTIKRFVDSKVCDQPRPLSTAQETENMVRVVLPFKDQNSAEFVKKQLKDLSLKVNKTIQPVFTSRKIEQN